MRPPFFSVDLLLANQPPLFNSSLCFNPTATFLGVAFDSSLFLQIYFRLRLSFPRLKVLRYIAAVPSILHNTFLRPVLTYTSRGWFSFFSAISSRNAFTKRPVTQSPTASCPRPSLVYPLRRPYLPYQLP